MSNPAAAKKVTNVEPEDQRIILLLGNLNDEGKTTISNYIIKASRKMRLAKFYQIESVNKTVDVKGIDRLNVNDMDALIEKIGDDFDGSYVVDNGASGYKELVAKLKSDDTLIHDVTDILIPVSTSYSAQQTAMGVIKELLDMGVEPEVIKVIWNKVPVSPKVEMHLTPVSDYYESLIEFLIKKDIRVPATGEFIPETTLFVDLANKGKDLAHCIQVNASYKQLRKTTPRSEMRTLKEDNRVGGQAKVIKTFLSKVRGGLDL